MWKIILCALSIAAISAPVAAQDAAAPNHLETLESCQALADASQRLACYDTAVASLLAASDQGDLRIVDQEAVKQTRRRLFGFSLPDIGLFEGGNGTDDELEELESVVTSVRKLQKDAFAFEIEDGGLWQINNAPMRLTPPKTGDKVTFKKAALGSYFIRINGQIGVKGKRVQ